MARQTVTDPDFGVTTVYGGRDDGCPPSADPREWAKAVREGDLDRMAALAAPDALLIQIKHMLMPDNPDSPKLAEQVLNRVKGRPGIGSREAEREAPKMSDLDLARHITFRLRAIPGGKA